MTDNSVDEPESLSSEGSSESIWKYWKDVVWGGIKEAFSRAYNYFKGNSGGSHRSINNPEGLGEGVHSVATSRYLRSPKEPTTSDITTFIKNAQGPSVNFVEYNPKTIFADANDSTTPAEIDSFAANKNKEIRAKDPNKKIFAQITVDPNNSIDDVKAQTERYLSLGFDGVTIQNPEALKDKLEVAIQASVEVALKDAAAKGKTASFNIQDTQEAYYYNALSKVGGEVQDKTLKNSVVVFNDLSSVYEDGINKYLQSGVHVVAHASSDGENAITEEAAKKFAYAHKGVEVIYTPPKSANSAGDFIVSTLQNQLQDKWDGKWGARTGRQAAQSLGITPHFNFDRGFVRPELVTISAGGLQFNVAKQYAGNFQMLLDVLKSRGYKFTGDDKESGSGGFNARTTKTGAPSQHARGNAIDIRPGANPDGSQQNDFPSDIGLIAQICGISWGGYMERGGNNPDPMHFEYHEANNVPPMTLEEYRANPAQVAANLTEKHFYFQKEYSPIVSAEDLNPGRDGKVSPIAAYNYAITLFEKSRLNDYFPKDSYGRRLFDIATGSARDWAKFLISMVPGESGFKYDDHGDKGRFSTGSRGLLQLSGPDAVTYNLSEKYGLKKGEHFTIAMLNDPATNLAISVDILAQLVNPTPEQKEYLAKQRLHLNGFLQHDIGRYWGPVRRGWGVHGSDIADLRETLFRADAAAREVKPVATTATQLPPSKQPTPVAARSVVNFAGMVETNATPAPTAPVTTTAAPTAAPQQTTAEAATSDTKAPRASLKNDPDGAEKLRLARETEEALKAADAAKKLADAKKKNGEAGQDRQAAASAPAPAA